MLPVPMPEAHTCCTPSPRQQGTGHRGKLAWGAPIQQQVQHLVHQDRPQCLTHLTCERLMSLPWHHHASSWCRWGPHRDRARAALQPAAAGSRCSPGCAPPGSLRAPGPSQTLCRHTLSFPRQHIYIYCRESETPTTVILHSLQEHSQAATLQSSAHPKTMHRKLLTWQQPNISLNCT